MPKIPTKADISNDVLIKAMRYRPALYDKSDEKFQDNTLRKKLWQEVCRKVFPKQWDTFTPYQQELAGVEVQMRWKNLRNSYSRELRFRKVDAARGRQLVDRKTYIYFNELSFLGGPVDPEAKYQSSSGGEESGDFLLNNMQIDIDTSETCNDDPYTTFDADTRKRKVSTEDLNQEAETEQMDAATHFAMSLIPFIRAVPAESKLDCEIMVLKVIKKFAAHKRPRLDIDPSDDPLMAESQNNIKKERS